MCVSVARLVACSARAAVSFVASAKCPAPPSRSPEAYVPHTHPSTHDVCVCVCLDAFVAGRPPSHQQQPESRAVSWQPAGHPQRVQRHTRGTDDDHGPHHGRHGSHDDLCCGWRGDGAGGLSRGGYGYSQQTRTHKVAGWGDVRTRASVSHW